MAKKASNVCIISLVLIFVVAGCGSVQHKVEFRDSYTPQKDTMIDIGTVSNETGETFDIEIEKMLTDALSDALHEKKLLWAGNEGSKLVLTTKIVEYNKGNAFKRWLLPGWGTTVLSIQCDLRDNDMLVGSAEARRTISIGGGYTVGAWKTIFSSIAKDVVKDIMSEMQN